MKRKHILLLVLSPLLLFVLLYGGGYIAQFIYNYDTWQQTGATPGDGTAPAFPSLDIGDCFAAVVKIPYGLYGTFIFLILIGLLILLVMRMGLSGGGTKDHERNLTYSNEGTYGTAGFMTEQEMQDVLEVVSDIKKSDGIILGQYEGKVVCLPRDTRFNRNFAVYGSSGSQKSRAFVRNVVFQSVRRGDSLILTDPKSELYESMSQYLRDSGYTVRVFNLVNPAHSDSWNCLREINGEEMMAQIFADTIIRNTSAERGDHFWDSSEMNLLKALCLYVDQGYPDKDKYIGEVIKLLTLKTGKELDAIFELLPLDHPAKAPYQLYHQAPEQVRTSVITGLGIRLQIFQSKLMREITRYNEIDLTLPGRERCAYFCIISDQDTAFNCLSSLFFSFLFIKLVRFADQECPEGKLPVAVNIVGDEWPNVGTVQDFTRKISTIRSRNINMMGVIFQNVAQLQNRYPNDEWQEILGNCDTQIFLGATDEVTAKLVSNRTGETSIDVSSQAKMLGTWRISDYTPQYRETRSVGRRKLLTMDEVLRMPITQELVILRGQKVLRLEKYDYTLHPEAKKLRPAKASEHIPEWYKHRDTASTPTPEPTSKRSVKRQPSTKAERKSAGDTNPSVVPSDKKSILS